MFNKLTKLRNKFLYERELLINLCIKSKYVKASLVPDKFYNRNYLVGFHPIQNRVLKIFKNFLESVYVDFAVDHKWDSYVRRPAKRRDRAEFIIKKAYDGKKI